MSTSKRKGHEFIIDGEATHVSPALFDAYKHAMTWIETADALEADGVCEGVAALLADAGYFYNYRSTAS